MKNDDSGLEVVRCLHKELVEICSLGITPNGIVGELLLVGRYIGQLEILRAHNVCDERIVELVGSLDSIVHSPIGVYSLLLKDEQVCRPVDKLDALLCKTSMGGALKLLCTSLESMRSIRQKRQDAEAKTSQQNLGAT